MIELRIEFGEGCSEALKRDCSEESLKSLGHNLYKLLNKVEAHYEELKFPEPFPKSVKDIILEFHEADRNGTAFRYSGSLRGTEERIDFPESADLLNRAYILLGSISEYASSFSGMPFP
ncbi:hypothetical protein C5Y44_10660 [Corynebacterium sp. J010B-136]|nr:hypothetical protein C5Y44_10660 [Corynebacterium sp. J010B-136]